MRKTGEESIAIHLLYEMFDKFIADLCKDKEKHKELLSELEPRLLTLHYVFDEWDYVPEPESTESKCAKRPWYTFGRS